MSLAIIPFRLEHFHAIEWQEAQAFAREYTQSEWIEDVAAEMMSGSDAWSAVGEDGAIIACAGVWPTRILRTGNGPDVCVESMAWAIFSPSLSKHAKGVFRAIRDFLNEREDARIEAWVYASHDKAAPFLERLGFVFEREDNGVVHPGGYPMKLYARVRH